MKRVRQMQGGQRGGRGAMLRWSGGRRRSNPRGALLALSVVTLLGCGEDEAGTPLPLPEEPSDDARFQKVTLNGAPGEPIGLVVLPDGRVLHTTRNGRLFLHDPATGFNRVIASIPVYEHDEEGLQGIAIDESFAENNWLYVYYSPPLATPTDDAATPDFNEGDAPTEGSDADFAPFRGALRLSRFRLSGETLALDSEQNILEIPVDRGACCHVGGQIDFDSQGNLLLSTGDDTNPFESNEYTPIDERAGRSPTYDAQRSSGNTNDLRGKLLRIRVQDDGTYTIPAGNLFPPGTEQTRPEIYAMGLRNPFRYSVDRRSDVVYLADYSPDADLPDTARGPAGTGKWTVIRQPGNYGWPYCATAELPYVDYDFETETSGEAFDCSAPVNDSPRNTGLRQLPPVVQPELWYSEFPSEQFPELGLGGVAPMGGPAYHYDESLSSRIKWPAAFDGIPLFYEWSRNGLFGLPLADGGGLGPIRRLFPELPLRSPIDMEFGPDGALYVLEYGTGFNLENPDAQLSRIDYVRGNRTPVPTVTPAIVYARTPPISVELSSEGTADPDGDGLSLFWDFDQDGVVDSTEPNPTVTFDSVGSFGPSLRVVDSTGRAATVAARVVVGNTPPVLTFVTPQPGDPFRFGQTIEYEVAVEDDQPFVCSRMEVTYFIAHDTHPHPLSTAQGCRGSFDTPPLDKEHAASGNVAGGFFASYQDSPGPGLPPLESTRQVLLLPTPGGAPDAGPAAAVPDASTPEASQPDAGAPDASAPDAEAP